jgi:hydrogenase nickel incorporation protein HypA/HybF
MHEMSLIQSVVEICVKNAAGRRVLAVTLEIGELSGVMPEALEFCFDVCTTETLLDGAVLAIERVPGRGRCGCGAEFPLSAWYNSCPACGGFGVELLSGKELRVKELEVA